MPKRCQSCRWWERSNNFRAADRDWGLCHFWGGKSGRRILGGFIDYSFGHEPRGSDTCEWHNADPEKKPEAIAIGTMPDFKCEGDLVTKERHQNA
jgi:hypothetical protein